MDCSLEAVESRRRAVSNLRRKSNENDEVVRSAFGRRGSRSKVAASEWEDAEDFGEDVSTVEGRRHAVSKMRRKSNDLSQADLQGNGVRSALCRRSSRSNLDNVAADPSILQPRRRSQTQNFIDSTMDDNSAPKSSSCRSLEFSTTDSSAEAKAASTPTQTSPRASPQSPSMKPGKDVRARESKSMTKLPGIPVCSEDDDSRISETSTCYRTTHTSQSDRTTYTSQGDRATHTSQSEERISNVSSRYGPNISSEACMMQALVDESILREDFTQPKCGSGMPGGAPRRLKGLKQPPLKPPESMKGGGSESLQDLACGDSLVAMHGVIPSAVNRFDESFCNFASRRESLSCDDHNHTFIQKGKLEDSSMKQHAQERHDLKNASVDKADTVVGSTKAPCTTQPSTLAHNKEPTYTKLMSRTIGKIVGVLTRAQ